MFESVLADETLDRRDYLVLGYRLDLLDDGVACLAFCQDEQTAPAAACGDDCVHLPVAEPATSVDGLRSLFDREAERVPV